MKSKDLSIIFSSTRRRRVSRENRVFVNTNLPNTNAELFDLSPFHVVDARNVRLYSAYLSATCSKPLFFTFHDIRNFKSLTVGGNQHRTL